MYDAARFDSLKDWRQRTVGSVLVEQARLRGGRPALQLVGEAPVDYATLFADCCALGAGLRGAGVAAGDTVVVFAPNALASVRAWLAINLIGACEVWINSAYRGATLEHALNTAQARHLVIAAEFLPTLYASKGRLPHLQQLFVIGAAEPAPADWPLRSVALAALADAEGGATVAAQVETIRPADAASVIYTSGTTGPAKGVVMPHAQVSVLAASTVRGLRLGETDTFYCFHPMFHMAGKFMAVLGTWMAGGRLVLDRVFQPDAWLSRVREFGATASLAHGPMIEMIHAQPVRADDAANPVRRLLAGPLPRRIAEAFERRFGLKGIEVWGMTEVAVPLWHPIDEPLRPGSCGRNDDEMFELRVADSQTDEELPDGVAGELLVRPRFPFTIMQGYLGMPDQTVETWRNLWFHTGDTVIRDAGGWYRFVDRMKDRIRRRAENVSSYDIESAALAHPGIAEAAVVGVPSEFEGDDDIKLCIVPTAGAEPAMLDLLEHLCRLLPHAMVPRYIEPLQQLPRTPTNKVRKAELRRLGSAAAWDRKAAGVDLKRLYENIR